MPHAALYWNLCAHEFAFRHAPRVAVVAVHAIRAADVLVVGSQESELHQSAVLRNRSDIHVSPSSLRLAVLYQQHMLSLVTELLAAADHS